MPVTSKTLHLPNTLNSRADIRSFLISEFLQELPGNGSGDLVTRYLYEVENCVSGKKIFLSRPAPLNKGMDFRVQTDTNYFATASGKSTKIPSHYSVTSIIEQEKNLNPKTYILLKREIENIYNIRPFSYDFLLSNNLDTELLLKTIKWLFIEQDITYWNWSGRAMLKNKIDSI